MRSSNVINEELLAAYGEYAYSKLETIRIKVRALEKELEDALKHEYDAMTPEDKKKYDADKKRWLDKVQSSED